MVAMGAGVGARSSELDHSSRWRDRQAAERDAAQSAGTAFLTLRSWRPTDGPSRRSRNEHVQEPRRSICVPHFSLGSGHQGRRRSLSIAGGDRAVVSNPNACLPSNSSPSCAVHQYSSNASTFAPVSREPAASTIPAAAAPARQSPAPHPASAKWRRGR
jgi:hypothetical protein